MRNKEYIDEVVARLRTQPERSREPLARWDLYRLLAEPTRLKLLSLCAQEELAVSELAELLREGQPNVSRQAAALRDAGLLHARKQGTWLLLRLAPAAELDLVVADALAAGRASCEADGVLARVAEVLAARDRATREFFARADRAAAHGPPDELAVYLRALAPLVAPRRLAIDAGTGNGALLEVLAPLFEQVIALDRSEAQLELARARAAKRAFRNVRFVHGELDGPELTAAIADSAAEEVAGCSMTTSGADAVLASRVLHHAPSPARAFGALARLARAPANGGRGGAVLVLEYEPHHDEAMRAQQADLWLGFSGAELVRWAREAGLGEVEQTRLPQAWCGHGADAQLGWQLVSGWREADAEPSGASPSELRRACCPPGRRPPVQGGGKRPKRRGTPWQ